MPDLVLAAGLIIYKRLGLSSDDWKGWGVSECAFVLVLVTALLIGLMVGQLVGWAQSFRLLTLDTPLSPPDQISK